MISLYSFLCSEFTIVNSLYFFFFFINKDVITYKKIKIKRNWEGTIKFTLLGRVVGVTKSLARLSWDKEERSQIRSRTYGQGFGEKKAAN